MLSADNRVKDSLNDVGAIFLRVTFESWQQIQPPNGWLSLFLKRAHSQDKAVALIAKTVLIIVYCFSASSSASTQQTETEYRTTDEVAQSVLQNLQPNLIESQSDKTGLDAAIGEVETDSKKLLSVQELQPPERSAKELAEVFLTQMKDQTKTRDEALTEELRALRRNDGLLFTALMIAAAITILLTVVGAVLLFSRNTTLGIVAEGVGLLPGVGTLIFRRLSTETRGRMNQVTKIREDNLKVLQAIQATLLIPDIGKRTDGISSLASKLADRAMKAS